MSALEYFGPITVIVVSGILILAGYSIVRLFRNSGSRPKEDKKDDQ